MDDKRIYAIVAEKVETPLRGVVTQIPGRMSAQLGHAIGKARMYGLIQHMRKLRRYRFEDLKVVADAGITTIQLQCRDGRELQHVALLLTKGHIRYYDFEDENPAVYGAGGVITALATEPVYKEQTNGILDYLPLFLSDFPQSLL